MIQSAKKIDFFILFLIIWLEIQTGFISQDNDMVLHGICRRPRRLVA